jgi:hypothetical protein
MASPDQVFALHRYFLQANQMRASYDGRLAAEGVASLDDDNWTGQWIDLCLWYACLYVVIEGWVELQLSDPRIDNLLASPRVDVLKRFRNGVVHFQAKYWDDRLMDFIADGANSAAWARKLNAEFGRFFLQFFQAQREGEPKPS